MTSEPYSKDYIKQITSVLIKSLKLPRPYDPNKVIELTNGTVERRDIDNENEAEISIDGKDSYKIILSQNTTPQRERFTLAHELGHLFLHYGFLTNDTLWNNAVTNNLKMNRTEDFNGSQKESEANEFAACFLMPEEDFTETFIKYSKNGLVDLVTIANEFDVSILAAQTRAKWLGLIEW